MELIKLQVSCLIILLFIATIYFRAKRLKTKTGDCFSALLLAMILNITMDAITVITINNRDIVPPILNRILCGIFQESLILVLMLNSNYVFYMIQEELKSYKTVKVINYIPFIISTIVNICVPVKYMDTPSGTYTYGGPSNVCYSSVVIYVIISGVRLFTHYKEIAPRKRNITLASLIIFLVVAGYGATNPTLLIHGFGLTLIVFATFLTVESPDARLIELLQIEKERADEASKAKGNFLANMSHEIRTPINAILGMNTIILRKSNDSEIRKYADNIQSAGRSLLSIINDILDFSKIESGKMELVPVDYNFSSLVNDVFNMINTKAEDKGLLFEIDIDSKLPCGFYGDDVRIRQILVNLLTNAVKYTTKGKVTLKIYAITELSGDKENCFVRFEIKDTGIGIKSEDINKLTEEFVRIEESRNRNIEGTGLGINIVIRLLDLMGSKLEVDSVYGKGSVFAFTLDQPVTNSEAVGDITERIKNICHSEEEFQVSFSIPDARILVVDDNSMNLTVFSSLLSDMLCRIDEADSGKRCLELVKENKYDIIFLDHMMPGMDGIETFHHMQELGEYINSDTPVIILTANAISGAKEAYLAEGFNDYLSKPIELRALEEIIKQYLPPKFIKEPAVSANKYVSEITFSKETIDAVEGIIDLKKGYSYSANKKDSYDAIIKSYIKKGYERLDYIQKLFAAKDWSNYVIEVHALKSTSLTIGAVELSELAKELELSGKIGDIDVILDKNDLLLTLYKDAIDAAQVYVKNEISDEVEKVSKTFNIDTNTLKEILSGILDAAESFDSSAVIELISDKKNYEYEGEYLTELFEKIETATNDFDYDAVAEVVKEFKKKHGIDV